MGFVMSGKKVVVCPRTPILYSLMHSLRLGSRRSFDSFPFAHPSNIVSYIDTKCFCSNVFAFPPLWCFFAYSSLTENAMPLKLCGN